MEALMNNTATDNVFDVLNIGTVENGPDTMTEYLTATLFKIAQDDETVLWQVMPRRIKAAYNYLVLETASWAWESHASSAGLTREASRSAVELIARSALPEDSMLTQVAKREIKWLKTLEDEVSPNAVASQACIEFFTSIPVNSTLQDKLSHPIFDCVGDGGIQCEWRKDKKGVIAWFGSDGRVFLHQFMVGDNEITQHDFKFPAPATSVEVLKWFNKS